MDTPKYEDVMFGPVFFTHCCTCGKRLIGGDSGSAVGPARAYADSEYPNSRYKCISCVTKDMDNFWKRNVGVDQQ